MCLVCDFLFGGGGEGVRQSFFFPHVSPLSSVCMDDLPPRMYGTADKGLRVDTSVATLVLNLLNPTGHVMHQQFNIQQLYALPTLYLCVLYLSENKQRLVPLTA